MKKNTEQRIEDLKKVVAALIDAQLQLAGCRDAEGEYIPGTLQNLGFDPKIAERLLALGCAVEPLRGQAHHV